jgi:hypothetical protein
MAAVYITLLLEDGQFGLNEICKQVEGMFRTRGVPLRGQLKNYRERLTTSGADFAPLLMYNHLLSAARTLAPPDKTPAQDFFRAFQEALDGGRGKPD